MVLKSKGGKKTRSSISRKRQKNEMKHHRKTNYKKKKQKQIECCICYEMAPDNSDNTITCGKTTHPLCADCKVKVDDTGGDCPMCRSHRIPLPKSQMVDIRVIKAKIPVNWKPMRRIKVDGMVPSLDGIYGEIRKDKNRYSVYKNENGYYLYRSCGKYTDWVFNSEYKPKTLYVIGWSGGKLFGNTVWRTCTGETDEFVAKYVNIMSV